MSKAQCAPLNYDELNHTLHRLGIQEISEWLGIILFVRDLISRMDIISPDRKYDLQQMVLETIEKKDFSEKQLNMIIKEIQNGFTDSIDHDAKLVEQKLDNEKNFTHTLIRQIQVLAGEFKKSVTRQSDELNDLSEKTITDIQNQQDPDHIIQYIRGTITKIVADTRKEAMDWESKAKSLEDIAKYDNLLKNLYNRSYFDEYLQATVDAHLASERSLSLLMIDVDNFKNINDAWGHLVGDDILKALAKLIHKHSDIGGGVPCRYGGEELCIIFDNTDEELAMVRAEELRKDVETYNFVPRKKTGELGDAIHFTISLGVAALKPDYDSSSLISAADKAMYKAKSDGRNKVVCHSQL